MGVGDGDAGAAAMTPQGRGPRGNRPRHMVRGEHVFLRPAERSDIPLFVRWLNDLETTRSLSLRAPLSLPLEERWFDDMLARQGNDAYHFVICLLADERPIGTAGLFAIDELNGNAGFGIVIGEAEFRGRGHGTDALAAMCDFGFGELRLERIWLDVFTDNAPAKRSYEKAGFTVEGVLRHDQYRSGRFRDVYRMALLRGEWQVLARPKSWELGPS